MREDGARAERREAPPKKRRLLFTARPKISEPVEPLPPASAPAAREDRTDAQPPADGEDATPGSTPQAGAELSAALAEFSAWQSREAARLEHFRQYLAKHAAS